MFKHFGFITIGNASIYLNIIGPGHLNFVASIHRPWRTAATKIIGIRVQLTIILGTIAL